MIEQLSQMQTRIQTMRDAVHTEGTVMPGKEEGRITIPEVKIDVLWYLDRLAAAVAGAHRHMSTVEHHDCMSATDKERMRTRIVELLHEDLGWLPATVKDLDLQDLRNFELELLEAKADELQPSLTGHTREVVLKVRNIVGETFGQLSMVKNEVADMLGMLDAPMT